MIFIPHDQVDAWLDSLDEDHIVTGHIMTDALGIWVDDVEVKS